MGSFSEDHLAKILLKTGAIKFGTFTLTSGHMSPYYVDLRLIPSFTTMLKKVISLFQQVIEKEIGLESFNRIAGIPTGGLPFASILAYLNEKPLLYVRKETKTHGREKHIEGIISPGDTILMVDDLATTGKSLLLSMNLLKAEGGIIKDVVVLIDREEGAFESLKKHQVKLHAVSRISTLIEKLRDTGNITEDQFTQIQQQTKRTAHRRFD